MEPVDSLTLRTLRYFVTLAEDLHFGQAATRLGIAQPGLTQQIQRLERVLGVTLFERGPRRVTLTDAGHALVLHARDLLLQGERMQAHVQRVARGELGTLRVGFVASGAWDFLPPVVRRFRERYPDAHVEVDECGLETPTARLEAGTLDVAIVRGPITHPGLRVETLSREPLCAVVPDAHRLAHRARIELRAMAGDAFALFPRRRAPAFHDAITALCREAGFVPRITHEAADWQALVSLVAAGLVVTLAPQSVRRIPRAGVCYRDITPARAVAQLDIVAGPSPASPLVAAFIELAHEVAGRERGREGKGRTRGGGPPVRTAGRRTVR